MAIPIQLALRLFDGTADLACPSFDAVVRNVAIQFDPVELVFTVQLLAADRLVQNLATEHEPIEFQLFNVVLSNAELGVHLEAKFLDDLSRQNALSEWPESMPGYEFFGFDASGPVTRRLVLGPNKRKIIFTALASLDEERPYQIFYTNACSSLSPPAELLLDGRATPVRFASNNPADGFLCTFGKNDFFTEEKRIHAALELIHGRDLPPVLKVQGSEISFYGQRQKLKNNYLPLVKPAAQGRPLMDAVLAAMIAMPADRFEHERYAQIFLLLGKNADVPMEVRYLLMMTCIEAMDSKKTLQTVSTSQLLGISLDAATLLNGMRHKLTHGRGGYREAFQAVLSEQFDNRALDLELAFRDCITAEHLCDFVALWYRLAERLDAFWCAWLGISESLAAQRYSPVDLMPLPLDARLPPECAADPDSNETPLQIEDLARKNTALNKKNRDLNAELTAQGKLYARLKSQQAACNQTVSENQTIDRPINY